jgi:hypothetical protein
MPALQTVEHGGPMRVLAVILGTFVALFGLVFGGCAIAMGTAEVWYGFPNKGGIFWLVLVNVSLAVLLLRAAYRLFRGPSRRREADEDAVGP